MSTTADCTENSLQSLTTGSGYLGQLDKHLDLGTLNVIEQINYYFSLFSHKRLTLQWKGLIEIPLGSPALDAAAASHLASVKLP